MLIQLTSSSTKVRQQSMAPTRVLPSGLAAKGAIQNSTHLHTCIHAREPAAELQFASQLVSIRQHTSAYVSIR